MDTHILEDSNPNEILASNILKRFKRLRSQGVSKKDALLIIHSSAYETGHTDGHQTGYESGYNTGFQTGRILLQNEIARAQEQYMETFYGEQGEYKKDEGTGQYL